MVDFVCFLVFVVLMREMLQVVYVQHGGEKADARLV